MTDLYARNAKWTDAGIAAIVKGINSLKMNEK